MNCQAQILDEKKLQNKSRNFVSSICPILFHLYKKID
jgi:hypothetical protein